MKPYYAELLMFLHENGCDIGFCEICGFMKAKACMHPEHPSNTGKQIEFNIRTGRKSNAARLNVTIH